MSVTMKGIADKAELLSARKGCQPGHKKPAAHQNFNISKRVRHERKAASVDESGLSAKDRQEARNREYFRKLAAGEIKEPPMPRLINNQVSPAERSRASVIQPN